MVRKVGIELISIYGPTGYVVWCLNGGNGQDGVSGSEMMARRGSVEWVLGSRSRTLFLLSASAWGEDHQVAGRFGATACDDQVDPSHTPLMLEDGPVRQQQSPCECSHRGLSGGQHVFLLKTGVMRLPLRCGSKGVLTVRTLPLGLTSSPQYSQSIRVSIKSSMIMSPSIVMTDSFA